MPSESQRLSSLPPYVFSVIGDRIRTLQSQGNKIFRLDIGDPDMPPPQAVIDALSLSANNPVKHGYTGYRGLATFRTAVAEHYKSHFNVDLNPDTQVLPLIGSKEGIVNLSLAYLDRGNTALVPDIGYPSYAQGATLSGAEACWIKIREENNFLPKFEEISPEMAKKAKLLWLNYPNNPTGAVAGLEFYKEAHSFCEEYDLLLVSDNPYVDVTYDDITACSALQVSSKLDHLIEFFSFSKSYNMAGWRLGAAVGSSVAIKNLLTIKSNMDSGHFAPIYDAGIKALQTPQSWIDERNTIYQRRRDSVMSYLPRIGLSAQVPHGALYIWAQVKDESVQEYLEQALVNAHVSLAPGLAYGPGGEQYIRMSFSVPDNELQEALERLEVWYASR